MKKNNSNNRGGFSLVGTLIITAVIALFAAFCLPSLSYAANYIPVQGVYIDGSTSTTVVGSTTNIVSVVSATTTNYFNLTGVNGSQSNTNLWPKLGFTSGRDSGISGRNLALQSQFNCTAANSGNVTFRYAGSVDATHWQTNPCPLVITATANGTSYVQTLTNLDTGGYPFVTLFSVENTNSAAVTNLWLGGSSKNN